MVRKKRHFAGSPPKREEKLAGTAQSTSDQDFIRLVKERQYLDAISMMDQVGNINVADPDTGCTALHYAAARSAMGLLTRLETRDDLDYLVRDRQNRFPSDVAWVHGQNEQLGAQLMDKERQQAERDGTKVWPAQEP